MNFGHIMILVVIIVGGMQWLKSVLEHIPPVGANPFPAWAWALILLPVSILISLLSTYAYAWVTEGLFALAVAQLAYDNIVKLVQSLVDKSSIGGK